MKKITNIIFENMEKYSGSKHKTPYQISWLTFSLSGGFLVIFLLMALLDLDGLSHRVNVAASWSTKHFGAYWQALLLLTFLIGIYVASSRSGKVRLGNKKNA